MLSEWINMLRPWQWLLLAAVPPAIIALYFLKLKRFPLEVPSTYLWKKTIEDLHVWLEEECEEPCRALTIPHNSNASSSQIFWEGKNSDGSAV